MWREFSWNFHVIACHKLTAVWSKCAPNSMTIPCSFVYPGSIFFHAETRHGFWSTSSHGNSMTFHAKIDAVWSKSIQNFVNMPCYLCGYNLFSTLEHDMDFTQVQVMEFPWHLLRKLWDFHRIWCHFRPNCRQKDMKKSASHFLQGKN